MAATTGESSEPGPAKAPLGARLHRQLGAILLELGYISEDDLENGAIEAKRTGGLLGDVLVSRGFVTSEQLARALAAQHGIPFLDLADVEIDRAVAVLLPERLAREYAAVAVDRDAFGVMRVAVADPTNVITEDNIRMVMRGDVGFHVVPVDQLQRALAVAYRRAEFPAKPAREALAADGDAAPAVAHVNRLVARACELGASDIHIVPQAHGSVVRMRVDGILRTHEHLAPDVAAPVTARVKVLAQVDIAEKRLPQDGHFTLPLDVRTADVRAAVVPTSYGEQVVLRIHEGSLAPLEIADLGMSADVERRFVRAIAQPHGAIIVCGPTGSGKTTTLYGALQKLNDGQQALMTIEDPVERAMPGVAHVQVNVRAGLTFASGLRTILRADPDVLLVGEIRDAETADIAMKAALSGHLVLTSVHAPGAASALSRLRDLGLTSSVLLNAIHCIVSQRLVRRLCESCREPVDGGDDAARFRARGCAACAGTGYNGRLPLHEILTSDDDLEGIVRAIAADTTDRGDRLRHLRADGLRLCRAGLTTPEEVERVLGPPPEPRLPAAP